MEKKRFVSFGLALLLSTGLLTGCGKSDTQATAAEETESFVEEDIVAEPIFSYGEVDQYEERPENKEYKAYEHVFMLRYNLLDDLGVRSSRNISGASFANFEGYEIVSIQNFDGVGRKIGTTQTYGFDVWYVNTVPVVVEPVYHKDYKCYDYSQPGQIIEQEIIYDNESKLQK